MSLLGIILLVFLILLLVGGLTPWGSFGGNPYYGAGYGWGGGGIGLILVIILVLVLLGHL